MRVFFSSTACLWLHVALLIEQSSASQLDRSAIPRIGSMSLESKVHLGVESLGHQRIDFLYHDTWGTPLVNGCPKPCAATGPDPLNWTQVHSKHQLWRCDEDLLFDMNIYGAADGRGVIRTCSLRRAFETSSTPVMSELDASRRQNFQNMTGLASKRATSNLTISHGCGAHLSTVPVILSASNKLFSSPGENGTRAAKHLADYLLNSATCGTTILFAKTGPAITGLYVGGDIEMGSFGQLLLKYGAIRAVKLWSEGGCLDRVGARVLSNATVLTILSSTVKQDIVPKTTTNSTLRPSQPVSVLVARGVCRVIQVQQGDSCASLSSRCGIRGRDFSNYNPKRDLCSTLMPKQWVCCSEGNLPDMRPQRESDGTCRSYRVQSGDGCWAIANNFGLEQRDIEDLNKMTWGWAGCAHLQAGQIICLSEGNTPMPAQVDGVRCGPQKPGTQKPSGSFTGKDLEKLNPCPLNACCSGWGYCDTGAPGAFKPGTNGCISNCEMDIVGNEMTPGGFARVGYFQGYNPTRKCLRMDASEIESLEGESFSHVHFAFAGITHDFNVRIPPESQEQFEKFSRMEATFRKILSFGGWAESTEPATFQLYRDAVKPENRLRFAKNVVTFLDRHGFQGVDFDWEYPGATDIPGTPPGSADEGQNYYRFLVVLRELLGWGQKTISIALPSSFWYLQNFPVDKMAKVLNYFIYMTYDLHGQWDYGNKWSNPGCPSGNCLRSHINRTETFNSLVMVSKAGVPPWKLYVGVASYGRSFRMSNAGCTGPMCTFTGSFTVSEAEPGFCTETAGYTNADIRLSDGTHGGGMTDWVAYMEDDTKSARRDWIRRLNFGGTTDWAMDLAEWHEGPQVEGSWSVQTKDVVCNPEEWPSTLEELSAKLDKIPQECRARATVGIMSLSLSNAIKEYQAVSNDYGDQFGWYADWVKDAIDPRLEEFMAIGRGEGLKYMDCKWWTEKNEGEGPCTEARLEYIPSLRAGPRDVEFKMRDEEGFYKALLENTGISKDWITWRDHAIHDPCLHACPPSFPGCSIHAIQCSKNYYMRKNFPRRINDKDAIHVENPKKIVDDAIPNMGELVMVAISSYLEMTLGLSDADDADIIEALSMPLFMLEEASRSIVEIKKIGKEHKEEKTKELVMMILNIVFAAIPFVGQAGTALGAAASIARAALIVGELGNIAISVVEIIDNPESAPFAILGVLLGAGGLRSRTPKSAFKEAVKARRALSPADLKRFSPEFRRRDGVVQGILWQCVR
uniref:chitinase n=1 Tax=Hypocrella siamensis TaxID=696354 RepID=A0A0P0BVC1_9HYPO